MAAFRSRRPARGALLPRRGRRAVPAAERGHARAQHRPVHRAARRRARRRRPGRGGCRDRGHRASPRPVHQQGRAAADRGQLRAGRRAAAGGPGLGAGRLPAVPVPAERLGQRAPGWCWSGRGTRPGRSRPRCCAGGPGLRQAGGARLGRRRPGPPAGRAGGARPRPARRRRPSPQRGRPQPAARSAAVPGERLDQRALQAQAADDPRRLLAACRRGLAVLDEHRFTLGASELRAQATAHGAELALLAQRHAAAGAAAPGCCWPGASAGGRPRSRSRRCGRRRPELTAGWWRCAR